MFVIGALWFLVNSMHPNLNKPAPYAIRITWKRGADTKYQDIPADGKVYWIFTKRGIFYFDTTVGEVFKLNNLKQIGKDDQEFVLANLEEISKKWSKK